MDDLAQVNSADKPGETGKGLPSISKDGAATGDAGSTPNPPRQKINKKASSCAKEVEGAGSPTSQRTSLDG